MPLVSNEPTPFELPDLKLVGVCTFADFFAEGQHVLFGQTWERFGKQKHLIENATNKKRSFAIELFPPEFPTFRQWCYSACLEVADLNAPQPPGMIARFIPAARYLRFTVRGDVTEIGAAFRFVYGEWRTKAGAKLNGTYDMEYYDERFKGPCNPSSEMDILLPFSLIPVHDRDAH